MGEKGGWPRLRLLLLFEWMLLFLVASFSLAYFFCMPVCMGSWGFYRPTPRGYNGNVTSRRVRIVGVRGPGLGPAEGLWFAGFP